jgi:hypothetical protein
MSQGTPVNRESQKSEVGLQKETRSAEGLWFHFCNLTSYF